MTVRSQSNLWPSNETGLIMDRPEGAATAERIIRIVLLAGFLAVLAVEAWLLWQVWQLWT